MPTDIEGLSELDDERLIREHFVVSARWHVLQPETRKDIENELLNRMSGAGWRSVEEGLPDEESNYLTWRDGITEILFWGGKHWWKIGAQNMRVTSVRYWKPINPPEEG